MVVLYGQLNATRVSRLLAEFRLSIETLPAGAAIPHSYWGEPEAGLQGDRVFVRLDTPAHSLLHEACHSICAGAAGRSAICRDAGGDQLEECAVCYLQVLLANKLGHPMSKSRMLADMDEWGYSFRQGSAAKWFMGDGADGRDWLFRHGVYNFVGFGASP